MSELTDQPTTNEIDIHPEDLDDEWSTGQVRTGLRLRVPTAALLAVIVLAGGFWGGAVAEKHHGSGSSQSNSLSALASRFAAARGTTATGTGTGTGTGFGGFAGTGGGAVTTGTVIGLVGQTLEISNAAGNIVKIDVGPSTTITRTVKSTLAGLQVGDTVIVSGATGAGGTVTATAVRASAAGVTATAGARGLPAGG